MEKDVPYIVYESEAARHERTVKRLIVALIMTICLLVASNMAWLYVFSGYDMETQEVSMDTETAGNVNYIGQDGEITNAEGSSEDKNND